MTTDPKVASYLADRLNAFLDDLRVEGAKPLDLISLLMSSAIRGWLVTFGPETRDAMIECIKETWTFTAERLVDEAKKSS